VRSWTSVPSAGAGLTLAAANAAYAPIAEPIAAAAQTTADSAVDALALKASLNDPAFTGDPTLNGGAFGTAGPLTSSAIVETSTGVWSGDAPVRTAGQYPVIFSGVSDPADVTNGITTPTNIGADDIWLQQI
jgi:hypothetical protein